MFLYDLLDPDVTYTNSSWLDILLSTKGKAEDARNMFSIPHKIVVFSP